MKDALAGLRDKLYWRPVGATWHCFKRTRTEGQRRHTFVSLCTRHEITASGGQAIDRPVPPLRCGGCDGAEMQRRGVEESMPARPVPRALR